MDSPGSVNALEFYLQSKQTDSYFALSCQMANGRYGCRREGETYEILIEPERAQKRVVDEPLGVDVDGRLAPALVAYEPVEVEEAPVGRACWLVDREGGVRLGQSDLPHPS